MQLRLISALGLVALLACAWLLSNKRKQFPWRTVIWGMALQFVFALFILKTPIGLRLFQGAQVVMDQLNVYAYDGAKMVFGPLADAEMLRKSFGPAGGYVFAISVTATIILISSLSSLLYYWGVLQKVVAAMAWVMMKTMRTSGSESLAGASEGVMLSINVMGMLIAFVAVVALLNGLIVWPQHALGIAAPLTIQQMLGWLNAPFAWLMGVPWNDCPFIGQILGERIVLNEFVGYLDLSNFVKTHPGAVDPRSVTLASYALCGFANFSSIAIQIGGIGALAPARRHDLARLGFRAMVAGLLACYLMTTVIGIIL